MHLVKKKAKEEIAQLEQELLSVIQAMEEATLSENVALALSEVENTHVGVLVCQMEMHGLRHQLSFQIGLTGDMFISVSIDAVIC